MRRAPVDHEIKTLVTSEEYLAIRHAAIEDDRSVGGWVRQLIRQALRDRARLVAEESSRDEDESPRAEVGLYQDKQARRAR